MCIVVGVLFDFSQAIILVLAVCFQAAILLLMIYFCVIIHWFLRQYEIEHKEELDEENQSLFESSKDSLREELRKTEEVNGSFIE